MTDQQPPSDGSDSYTRPAPPPSAPTAPAGQAAQGAPSPAWSPPPPAASPYRGPGAGFEASAVNPFDWALIGIGAVLFVFSFFAYYSVDFGFASGSFGAWHFSDGTFVGWFAMVLGVLAAGAIAVDVFGVNVRMAVAPRVLALGLFVVSLVLYVIAIFALDDLGGVLSHGFSFWLSLVFVAVGAVLCLARIQQTGGRLPGALNGVPNIGSRLPDGARRR